MAKRLVTFFSLGFRIVSQFADGSNRVPRAKQIAPVGQLKLISQPIKRVRCEDSGKEGPVNLEIISSRAQLRRAMPEGEPAYPGKR